MSSSQYTHEIGAKVCAELALGRSLRSVCKDPGMPGYSTIFKWIGLNEEFRKMYEAAKAESADAIFEEILDIADDGTNDFVSTEDPDNPGYKFNGEHFARSRLRVDTRKWYVGRMKPKKYGDKLHTELTGADGKELFSQVDDKELARRIAFLLTKASKENESE